MGPRDTTHRTQSGTVEGGCKKILSDSMSASPGFTHNPVLGHVKSDISDFGIYTCSEKLAGLFPADGETRGQGSPQHVLWARAKSSGVRQL